MKCKNVKSVFQGAVSGRVDVVLALDEGEAKKLREALAVVHKYEKAALDAVKKSTKLDPRESDWYMTEYAVKNDKVIVVVKDGATG